MTKKRLPFPNEYIWIDDKNRIHVCNYITCKDGCGCENTWIDKKTLIKLIERIIK